MNRTPMDSGMNRTPMDSAVLEGIKYGPPQNGPLIGPSRGGILGTLNGTYRASSRYIRKTGLRAHTKDNFTHRPLSSSFLGLPSRFF